MPALLLFVGVWLLLTGGNRDALPLGLVAVTAALLARRWLRAPPRQSWSLTGIVLFIPYFLWQSARGGVDVTARALSPRLPISPALYRYRLGLPEGPSRVLFANAISLLPGTFTAELEGHELIIHLLDQEAPVEHQLRMLERRVAAIFGVPLPPVSGGARGG